MISSTQTNHPLAGVVATKVASTQEAESGASFLNRLRAAGLRSTQPRLAIFTALEQFQEPVSIEQIYRSIKSRSCDLVTVYRSLALFEELGLVTRTFSNNGTGLYEIKREGAPSYFVTCRESGKREAISEALAAELTAVLTKIEASLQERGYRNVASRVEFQGLVAEKSGMGTVVNELNANVREGVLSVSQ